MTLLPQKMYKSIWQNSTPFHDKNTQQTRNRGNYLNLIKAIYDNCTANIIPNGEKLQAFPLRPRTRQGSWLLPFLFNTVLYVPSRAFRQEKEIKDNKIGNEEDFPYLQMTWYYM